MFMYCKGLTSVIIPNSVTSIDDFAFHGCSSLTSINIPNSVKYIEQFAFAECKGLTSVIIGKEVKVIYNCAFSNCPEIRDVYCYAEQVPDISSQAFAGSYIEYATLHVPEKSVNAYKETEPWKNFKEIVALTDQEMGISGIQLNDTEEASYFTLDGKQVESPRKGVNIIRTSNGKTKKVVVK